MEGVKDLEASETCPWSLNFRVECNGGTRFIVSGNDPNMRVCLSPETMLVHSGEQRQWIKVEGTQLIRCSEGPTRRHSRGVGNFSTDAPFKVSVLQGDIRTRVYQAGVTTTFEV
jgi:hypothetical protein